MPSTATEQPMQCAHGDCGRDARKFTLYRVNPTGEVGVFMCRTHWHIATRARTTEVLAAAGLPPATSIGMSHDRIRSGR